ncbi:MAG: amidohydrolase family protein [Saprospiraceae bacterium]|nr:amidohydrolase family protein [Saprospiraceae bacterium]|tara:strand:- start:477 stop:2156 length:1680 start_codon:yes stop_codon:yes gene_type:complete
MKLKIWALCSLVVSLLFLFSSVQSQDEPGEVTRTYALTNVHITTTPGTMIKNGTVVIKDGLIHSVGQDVIIPADAQVIEADTMFLYAGFIDGLSHIGIPKPKEAERKREKDPGNPTNERAGITPEKSATSLLKATDKSISDYRAVGFTAAHTVPYGRMLPGQGSVILLDGDNASDLIYKSDMSTYGQLLGSQGVFPNTIIAVITKYRELYKQSQQASSHMTKYKSNSIGMKRPAYDAATLGLISVTKRQSTLFMSAHDHLDIHRVLGLQKDLGFKMALANVKNAYRLTDLIRTKNIPVLLSLDLFKKEKEKKKKKEKKEKDMWDKEKEALNKRKAEERKSIEGQAAAFSKKGIRFGFSTDGASAKTVMDNVRRLIKAGLSEDAALAALTTYPAHILGVSQTMGTVQNGKIANLVVSKTPIFDEKSKVRYVFVDGNLHEYEEKKKDAKKKEGKVSDKNKAYVGTWEFSINIGDDVLKGEIVITESEDGTLQGEMTGAQLDSTVEIEEITIDGDELSFTADAEGDTISWKGTIDGDSMEGEVNTGPMGTFPITATRTSSPE